MKNPTTTQAREYLAEQGNNVPTAHEIIMAKQAILRAQRIASGNPLP